MQVTARSSVSMYAAGMARRAAGEGSIYKRKDGLWTCVLSLGFDGSRRVRKQVYGKTQREVRRKLTRLRAEHDAGAPLTTGREPTVAQFLDSWLTGYHPTVRPTTYRRAEGIVKLHLIPTLGRKRLTELTPADVSALLAKKGKEGLSPRTVQYIRVVLRTALAQAEQHDSVRRNVAALVAGPKVERVGVPALTEKQAQEVVSAVAEDRLAALYALTLATGLRQGEVLGLTWGTVDLDAGTLSVRQTLTRNDGQFELSPLKTSRSRRTIPIPAVALSALEAHRARQDFERIVCEGEWGNSWGLVFTTPGGTPLFGDTVTSRLHRLLARTSVPKLGFHQLRHGCATLMLGRVIPLSTIQDTLGHATFAITADVYAGVGEGLRADAANAINDALAGC